MMKVVVADDEGDLRALVRVTLEVNGAFTVVGEAETGRAAIELAEKHQPDAVVLDLGLPDLHGSEVLAAIRTASPRARVVIYSGAEPDAAIARRADAYVLKGGDLEILVQAIQAEPLPDVAATLELGTDATAVREARRFLSRHCRDWDCDDMVDDGLIVISELVSNAIRHAKTPSRLRLRFRFGVLRIEVMDCVSTMPQPRHPERHESSGRGLMLIAALTRAWGVDPDPDGKVVWAELSREPAGLN